MWHIGGQGEFFSASRDPPIFISMQRGPQSIKSLVTLAQGVCKYFILHVLLKYKYRPHKSTFNKVHLVNISFIKFLINFEDNVQ